jgi:hypothetical protein
MVVTVGLAGLSIATTAGTGVTASGESIFLFTGANGTLKLEERLKSITSERGLPGFHVSSLT